MYPLKKTAEQLSSNIAEKLEKNAKRKSFLEEGRSRTANFLQLIRQRSKKEIEINEEYSMVKRYREGEHLDQMKFMKEKANENLEVQMYESSLRLLVNSKEMKDFKDMHVGKVEVPLPSPGHIKYLNDQKTYIDFTHAKLSLYEKFQIVKKEVQHLVYGVSDKEDEIGRILADIEEYHTLRSFDWQAEMHRRVRELKAQVIVEKEDLEERNFRLKAITDEIQSKYPDMSSNIEKALVDMEGKHGSAGTNKLISRSGLNTPMSDRSKSVLSTDEVSVDALSFGDGAAKEVFGWVIGRLTSEGDILTLLFGQFTDSLKVPESDWIYMGMVLRNHYYYQVSKDEREYGSTEFTKSMSFSDDKSEVLEGLHDFNEDECDRIKQLEGSLRRDAIRVAVMPGVLVNSAISGSASHSVESVSSFRVQGCSLDGVDGRYLEWGSSCDVGRYRNVNGWVLFRHRFQEIPELNILAVNCYDVGEGPSMTALQDMRTEKALEDLLQQGGGPSIEEGSMRFKRRFAEVTRGGMRLISNDDIAYKQHEEQLRASARSEANKALLVQLRALSLSRQGQRPRSSEPTAPADGSHRVSAEGKEVHGGDDEGVGETSHSPNSLVVRKQQSTSSMINPYSSKGRMEATPDYSLEQSKGTKEQWGAQSKGGPDPSDSGLLTGSDLELKLTMSRNIKYQSGSIEYELVQDGKYHEREAELSRLVAIYIEEREAAIFNTKLEADKIHNLYLASHERTRDLDPEQVLGALIDCLAEIRKATILVAEGIGAWSRVIINQREKAMKLKKYNDYWLGKNSSQPSDNNTSGKAEGVSDKKYCVFIARKGKALYQQSEPFSSTMKRFNRSLESEKRSLEMVFVCGHDERDEAIKACQDALYKLPLENRPFTKRDVPKILVGLRPCHKHYIVRSELVPRNLECEVCKAKEATHPDPLVPPVTEERFPQYIWHGKNYVDVMWTDLNFLNDLVILKKFAPQLDILYNPLLLTRSSYNGILQFTGSRKRGSETLHSLKGTMELNEDAKRAARKALKAISEPNLVGWPYSVVETSSPFSSLIATKSERRLGSTVTKANNTLDSLWSSSFSTLPLLQCRGASQSAFAFNSNHGRGDSTEKMDVNTVSTVGSFKNKMGAEVFRLESQSSLGLMSAEGRASVNFGDVSYASDTVATADSIEEEEGEGDGVDGELGGGTVRWSLEEFASRHSTRKSGQRRLSIEFIEQGLSNIGGDRLVRALSILGQSVLLDRQNLSEAVIPDISLVTSHLSSASMQMSSSGSQIQLATTPSLTSRKKSRSVKSEETRRASSTRGLTPLFTNAKPTLPSQGLVPTVTYYTHHGAHIATMQYRQPVSHRIDDVWCRTDAGEWAGLYKQPGMKVFEFRQRQLIRARTKAKQRRRAQHEIRKSVDKHLADFDPKKIQACINEAMESSGTVLGLDIIRANKYIAKWEHATKHITKAQAHVRGMLARIHYKVFLVEMKEERQRRYTFEDKVAITAKDFVKSVLRLGVLAQKRKHSRAMYRKVMNIGGIRSVLTVHPNVRNGVKSFDLCDSCRNESLTIGYDYDRHKMIRRRSACTCRWCHNKESWLFKSYDPLDGTVSHSIFDERSLRDEVSLVQAMSQLSYEDHKALLVGKSFGLWDILLDPARSQNASLMKILRAQKKAGDDMATVSLLPKLYSSNLMRVLRGGENLPSDFFKTMLSRIHETPLVVESTDHESTLVKPSDWFWQPFSDILIGRRRIGVLEHDLDLGTQEAKLSERRWAESVQYRELCKHEVERSLMEVEDSVETLLRTYEWLGVARENVKRLIHDSLYTLNIVEEEEKNIRENRDRSWDPVNDAVSSKTIITRRKYEIMRKSNLQEFEERRARLAKNEDDLRNAIIRVHKLRREANDKHARVYDLNLRVKTAQDKMRETTRIAREAFDVMSKALTLPRHQDVPIKRKLRILNYRLSYLRDPLVRARKQNRLAWHILDRNVVFMRSIAGPVQWPDGRRFVVTIYADPVTNYKLVQIGQISDAIEEIEMHRDFQQPPEFYSLLTTDPEKNEILITPEDMSFVTKKPSDWPWQYLSRPVKQSARKPKLHTKTSTLKLFSEFLAASHPSTEESNLSNREEESGINSIDESPEQGVKEKEVKYESASNITPFMPESQQTRIVSGKLSLETEISRPPDHNDEVELLPRKSRPLDGIRVIEPAESRRSSLEPTYYRRRKLIEEQEKAKYKQLLSYLKLHPITGKPCLGLLHLRRRTISLERELVKTLWMTDLVTASPSSWTNEIFGDVRFISERMVAIVIRESWGGFEIKISLPKGYNVNVVISFESMVRSLLPKPLLLSSFLMELITNRYSNDTIDHIISRIDFLLPGEEHRLWRETFEGECPALKFLENYAEGYRGPVYTTHRIVSEQYFSIKIYQSASRDLRIRLAAPTDGSFWRHEYQGEPIYVDISRDELRAFVLKVSADATLVSKRVYKTLSLLEVPYWDQLFTLILDLIVLHPQYSRQSKNVKNRLAQSSPDNRASGSLTGDQGSPFSPAMSPVYNNDVAQFEEEPWYTQLTRRFESAITHFNAWVARHRPTSMTISTNTLQSALRNIIRLNKAPVWQLQLEKHEGTAASKRMEVFSGVGYIKDPIRTNSHEWISSIVVNKRNHTRQASDRNFTGLDNDDMKAINGNDSKVIDPRIIPTRRGDEEKLLSGKQDSLSTKEFDEVDFHHIGYGDDYLWLSKVYIDETRGNIYIKLTQSNINDPLVQEEVSKQESLTMAIEEDRSRQANYVYEAKLLQTVLLSRIRGSEAELRKHVQSYETQCKKIRQSEEILLKFQNMAHSLILSYFNEKVPMLVDRIQRSIQIDTSDTIHVNPIMSVKASSGTLSQDLSRPPNDINSVNEDNQKSNLFVLNKDPLRHFPKALVSVLTWLTEIMSDIQTSKNTLSRSILLISQHRGGKSLARPRTFASPQRDSIVALPMVTSSNCRVCMAENCPVHDRLASRFRKWQSWNRSRVVLVGSGYSSGEKPVLAIPDPFAPRIARFGDRIFFMSEPVIGPYDLATIQLYEPKSMKTWSILATSSALDSADFEPSPKLSFWNGNERGANFQAGMMSFVQSVDGSQHPMVPARDLSFVSQVSLVSGHEHDEVRVQTASLVADRFVWTVMSECMIKVVVRKVEVELKKGSEIPKEQLNALSSKLHRYEGQLKALENNSFSYKHFFRLKTEIRLEPPTPSAIQDTSAQEIAPRKGIIYGMLIPGDETVPPSQLETSLSEWMSRCTKLLKSRNISRTRTLPGLIYWNENSANSSSKLQENVRINKWIAEYIEFVGWRKGFDFIRHRSVTRVEMRRKDYQDPPLFHGDVVVLLRYGKQDFSQLILWLQKRREDFLKEQERERAIEEEKRSRILQSYTLFRNVVFETAERYLLAFERASGLVRKEILQSELHDNLPLVTEKQIRTLMSPDISNGSYEYLIDKDSLFKEESDSWNLFETYSIPKEIALLDESDEVNISLETRRILMSTSDVSVTSSYSESPRPMTPADFIAQAHGEKPTHTRLMYPKREIWYAVYHLHCRRCSRFNSYCPVPHCGYIRHVSKTIELNMREDEYRTEEDSEHFQEQLSLLEGTGRHPLELAIKRLYNGEDSSKFKDLPLQSQKAPLTLNNPIIQSRGDDVEGNDSEAIESSMDRYELIKAGKPISYTEAIAEAAQLRYLSRRIIQPAMAVALTAEELLEAKGGEYAQDERVLHYDTANELSASLPPAVSIDPLASKDEDDVDDAIEKESTEILAEATIEIPIELIKCVLHVGVLSDGVLVEKHEADPYPDKAVAKKRHPSDSQPMSANMFRWLTSRLYLYRYDLPSPVAGTSQESLEDVVPSSVTRNKSKRPATGQKIGIKFDRLHREGYITTLDGCSVFLQILHGALPNSYSTTSGSVNHNCPTIANRYLLGSELKKLQKGITLHVHDIQTSIGRAMPVKGADFNRLLDYFAILPDLVDYSNLSHWLMLDSKNIIKTLRVGSHFVGIELVYVKPVSPSDEYAMKFQALARRGGASFKPLVDIKAHGRREVFINRKSERLEAAKHYLRLG